MGNDLEKLKSIFQERYSSRPRFFRAPGRVNLIGEHTDYNEGFVMPFAIDRHVTVAGSVRDDRVLNAFALDLDESASIDLDDPAKPRRGSWIDYVEGTARCVERRLGEIRGADLVITSTVPIGAGLSSSAAIEIGIGMSLLSLSGVPIDERELAFAAQQAEHEFAGTRSGIMDQFTSVFGRADRAMLLDCRSLEIEHIPLPEEGVSFVAVDTKVKHNLASSEYNTRREECETGVELLKQELPQIRSLRDVTVDDLEEHRSLLSETVWRRCHHVITENERTLAAADALRRSDLVTAGELMWKSHRSLRDDYEVSCEELDFLVETANSIDGVFGARMTGGGFGGCTVNLVSTSAVEEFRRQTSREYKERFGQEPDVYVFRAADGASEIAD